MQDSEQDCRSILKSMDCLKIRNFRTFSGTRSCMKGTFLAGFMVEDS